MNGHHRDLVDDVRAVLQARGDRLAPRGGDPRAAVARGRRRQRARRAVVGSLAVILVLGATTGILAVTRGPERGTPVVTNPTGGGTESPSPTPTAESPSPTTSAEVETPTSGQTTGADATTEPTAEGPDLVVATDDGIVRVSGTRTTRVPGISGRVDLAFDDGQGGIIFQRNDQGIGRLADGEITTIVALTEFSPRTVEATRGDGEVEVAPTELLLMDVDAGSRRIIFNVHMRSGEQIGEQWRAVVTADLSGADRQELELAWDFEAGAHHSLGGTRRLVNRYSESGGHLTLHDAGEEVPLPGDVDYSYVTGTNSLHGGQLDATGTRFAVVEDSRDAGPVLQVRTVATGELEHEVALPLTESMRTAPTVPTDLSERWAITVSQPFDSSGPGPRTSMIIDLATGETTPIDGRAVLAR